MAERRRLPLARTALVAAITATCLAALVMACGPGETGLVPGGLQLEYQLVPEDGSAPSLDDAEAVASIMRARLDHTGLASFRVTPGASGQVTVETGVDASDAETAGLLRDLLGATGRLQLVPLGDEMVSAGTPVDTAARPPLLEGGVMDAAIGADQTGRRTLDLAFQPPGATLIERWTTDHVGEVLAVVLDGTVTTAPVVLEPIRDGKVQIPSSDEAGFSLAEAQRLVSILRSGAYPVPVREVVGDDGS
jgi:preprotein translocase subunit SecD